MNETMELFLRRKHALIQDVEIKENPQKDYSLISTFIRNAECYNYTFTGAALQYLASLSDSDFLKKADEMIEIFKTFVGEGDYMTPLYPNFPEQVMDLSEAELYYNAITHWASFGAVIPEFVDKEGTELPLFINKNKLTAIDVKPKEEYFAIFTNLIGGKGILSETDKADILYMVKSEPTAKNYMPESIPIKENLSAITMLFINEFGYDSDIVKTLSKYYKTATDVLRLATGLSTGDLNTVSLSENVKFKSFKRAERRFLLAMLENCGAIEEDMYRYSSKWIRLGEKLHPGEYTQFKKVNEAFKKIRNNGKGIITFNSKVQKAYEAKDVDTLIALLSSRPGEFARKLATVIRLDKANAQKVVSAFAKVADKVATPMLLEVASHFETVSEVSAEKRVFFPKGQLAKAYYIDNTLEPIEKSLADNVVSICRNAFVSAMKEKKSLGKVYIGEGLEDFVIPMKSRKASKQLRFVAKGTKFRIDEATTTIVPFVYWKEPKGERTDLDLSLVLFDKDFNKLEELSYYHMKAPKYGCYHSGDEQAAPKGAIECVSIDLQKATEAGAVYVVVCVNSYTSNPFCDLPECYVGLMEKEGEFSGKAFDPATVSLKSDLVSKSNTSLSTVINLVEGTMTWADMPILSNSQVMNMPNNVSTHGEGILGSLKYLMNIHKPTVYDMAILNAKARADGLVAEAYEADTIFSKEEVDTEVLLLKRAEVRKAEEEKAIMKEAMLLYSEVDKTAENAETLEDIVERLTTALEDEKAKNPLPKEEIRCITPYDVDVIVADFI